MGAHTKGPLVVVRNAADGFNIGVEQPVRGGNAFIRLGGTVAHRNPLGLAGREPIETAEALANGHLWAASPEMLEALLAQEDLQQRGILNMSDEEVARVTTLRRAAIAKATT